jgi:serine palmitoyltransferase
MIDVHLQLEEAMASFLKTNAAILYLDAASASTSAVAAFAKHGNLLIVDESIYKPLCTGVMLFHATVKHFCHNNMDHLENILKHQVEMDSKLHCKNAN